MPSRPQRFTVEILEQGPNPYVVVPPSVARSFARYAHRRHIRVFGTLDGTEIRGNLVPRGDRHWLFLHGGMRASAGVRVGDTVEIVLRATRWEEVPIAKDVEAALKEAGTFEIFEEKDPSHRHQLLRWVDMAESGKQRARRVVQMVAELRGKTEPEKDERATKRRRPLWTCPKCGHVFVNANQWHSCERLSLDDSFARSTPPMRELFDHLQAVVESVGPVHVRAYRDHVAFLVRVRFLNATPKKQWLDVGFWLPHRVESPRFRQVETLTPTAHVHVLRLTRAEELDDEVLGWIREGYALGEQRYLS